MDFSESIATFNRQNFQNQNLVHAMLRVRERGEVDKDEKEKK